ncbi:MAG: amidohydrolase [Longimicrobiales bacterium]
MFWIPSRRRVRLRPPGVGGEGNGRRGRPLAGAVREGGAVAGLLVAVGIASVFLAGYVPGAEAGENAPRTTDAPESALGPGPASEPADLPPYPGVYAFVDVNVVPMDARRVLERQTVVVRDGIIREMGPVDSVAVPVDAVIIEGGGERYILPGLGDMHARLPEPGGDDETLRDLLFLYLANGVTTVREGTGRPGHLALQTRLRREQLFGPTLYVASPPLEYRPTFDADSMNAAVTAVALAGWDLLRVSETLSLRGWDLLAQEIEDYAIGFGGPVPDSVGLHHALASGVSTIDHLDGLIEAAASDAFQDRIRAWYAPTDTTGSRVDGRTDGRDPPPPLDSLAATLSIRKARAVAGKARAAGVWMVPTLSRWELRQSRERPEDLTERPEMRYVPRETRGSWVRDKRALPAVDSLTAARTMEVRMATTKALNDVAGGLVLGTASPDLFNVPGFSVHREMELMQEAGITPYEILLAATRSVARYASAELREAGNFGTVTTGNRADLILVEANPLEDLSTLRDRSGVMVKGRWLPRAEIEDRLREIADRYEGPAE